MSCSSVSMKVTPRASRCSSLSCSIPPKFSCARRWASAGVRPDRSEEHTSELQSLAYLLCRLLLEKKKDFMLRTLFLEAPATSAVAETDLFIRLGRSGRVRIAPPLRSSITWPRDHRDLHSCPTRRSSD